MPRLDESTEALLRTGERVGVAASSRIKHFFDGFSDFALRDNVLEVAVGLM
jgi:large conductance mechanosensitive channel